MRNFHALCFALSVGEMMMAPHHWAMNHMIGFCDTASLCLKAAVRRHEPMLPIVSRIRQDCHADQDSIRFMATVCPDRARRHVISLLYELPVDTAVAVSERVFDDAKFRIRLRRKGKVFASSSWQSLRRHVQIIEPGGDFADCPFGRDASYACIALGDFDPCSFPWSYRCPIMLEVEFIGLDIGKYHALNAILCVRVYNLLEL